MLLRILPEKVSKMWGDLSVAIEKAIPAEERTDQYLNNVLEYVLRGYAHVWISYDPEEGNRPHGVVVTTPVVDPFSGYRTLMVLALAKFDDFNERALARWYQEGLAALLKYAKSRGYRGISGYIDSNNEYLIEKMKQSGAHGRFFFVI